jgi:Na+-driven multidrug efflux pump
MTLMCGILGVDELATQVVAYNLCGIIFMFIVGITQAASTLVGNYIG